MKKILLIVLVIAAKFSVAQVEPLLRQYMFNKVSLNPAFAGAGAGFEGAALYNHQWAGFEGAPRTIYAQVNGPISTSNVGLGLTGYYEQIGVHRNTNFTGQFSYRVLFKGNRKLAFGVQGSVGYMQDKGSELTTTFAGDDIYKQDFNTITYNAGAGIAYYDDRFYFGFSVPQLLRNRTSLAQGENKIKAARFNFNITTGYDFNISENWHIVPSTVIRSNDVYRFIMDINANFRYKEIVWFGPYYRVNTAYGLMLGVGLGKNVKLGYAGEVAQDMKLLQQNYGTHEVMLSFNLNNKRSKVSQSPRYF